MDYLQISNLPIMWFLCSFTVIIAALQTFLFMRSAKQATAVCNIDPEIPKNDNEGTAALTESEIRWIEKLTGSKDVVEKSTGIIEGDRVIITEGPLFGLESNITYINRHKHIARLTMDFLGEEREVEVPLEIVSKR